MGIAHQSHQFASWPERLSHMPFFFINHGIHGTHGKCGRGALPCISWSYGQNGCPGHYGTPIIADVGSEFVAATPVCNPGTDVHVAGMASSKASERNGTMMRQRCLLAIHAINAPNSAKSPALLKERPMAATFSVYFVYSVVVKLSSGCAAGATR